MLRRRFLLGLGAAVAGGAAWRYWPDDGLWNPCLAEPVPERLARHPLVAAAWAGIDPAYFWDTHVHLVGIGDGDPGYWVNPKMQTWAHPMMHVQYLLYLNGTCVDAAQAGADSVDVRFVQRLLHLHSGFPAGVKFVLLAFDYRYDANGRRDRARSHMYTSNTVAARVAAQYPQAFEWFASIHPYRADCVAALERAAAQGARGIKWLPAAMGIDPGAARCDAFYAALRRLDLTLLVHVDAESAVEAGDHQYSNPLLLRRPLEHGVRVLVAHCATRGTCRDLDQGADGPQVPCFELFKRLMAEPRYAGRLFGDISAVLLVNRVGDPLHQLVQPAWQGRLLNGSDYPLPGILPFVSLRQLSRAGFLDARHEPVLNELRRYNPLLFDFVLKRTVGIGGNRWAPRVYETRRCLEAGV